MDIFCWIFVHLLVEYYSCALCEFIHMFVCECSPRFYTEVHTICIRIWFFFGWCVHTLAISVIKKKLKHKSVHLYIPVNA